MGKSPDMTGDTTLSFSLSCRLEKESVAPLHCCPLENPKGPGDLVRLSSMGSQRESDTTEATEKQLSYSSEGEGELGSSSLPPSN